MKTKKRTKIYERDSGQCYLCSARLPIKKMTLDHRIPKRDGGSGKYANLACCCEVCNRMKGVGECILPVYTLTTNEKSRIMRAYRYFLRLKFDLHTQRVKRVFSKVIEEDKSGN